MFSKQNVSTAFFSEILIFLHRSMLCFFARPLEICLFCTNISVYCKYLANLYILNCDCKQIYFLRHFPIFLFQFTD